MNDQLEQYVELSKTFPSLIPLNGKVPTERNWQQWCKQIRPFNIEDFKGHNIGIPCGPINKAIAIDIDDLMRFSRWRNEKGYDLPKTRVHKTGRGTYHYIYVYPQNGKRYGCRSFKKFGFDIRGLAGQIAGPGSTHPDTGKSYTVLYDYPIAPAPQWLLDLAIQEEQPSEKLRSSDKPKWDGKLDTLPVSLPVKKMIREGEVKGQRSEAIFSVIQSLLWANINESTIISIFETCPIGEKYREKGRARYKWLQGEIRRAMAKIGDYHRNHKKSRGLTLDELQGRFTIETDWLWRQNIPRGQPIILNGREGIGKTTIAMVAAKEILQEYLTGSVVWLATEGKVLDTVNKMTAIGLDQRFYVGQKSDATFKFNFQWKSDIDELDHILDDLEKPILGVFIDSIRGMSPLGDNDDKIGGVMHRVNSVVCDKYRASLVYIDHWGKGKKDDLLDRNIGTTAKAAAVSAMLSVIGKTKYTREIKVAKSNIGQIPNLVSYQAQNQIFIRQPHEETEETIKARAEAFLLDLGAEQKERLAGEIYQLAEDQGINSDVLKKVKLQLGISSERESSNGPWLWRWPL